ncbi:uncharacterized protein LOC131226111 [Magnolia sinica]|uniref:uncharacterized protein LOC131226111 n=1 Tax=Magnolia sinica TaxID=86752 RepID=UPI0026590AAD|nr:uncharacterized protein LOC131226111 [Magnolia sinica]
MGFLDGKMVDGRIWGISWAKPRVPPSPTRSEPLIEDSNSRASPAQTLSTGRSFVDVAKGPTRSASGPTNLPKSPTRNASIPISASPPSSAAAHLAHADSKEVREKLRDLSLALVGYASKSDLSISHLVKCLNDSRMAI